MKNGTLVLVLSAFVLGVATRTFWSDSLGIVSWFLFVAFVVAIVWRRNSTAVSAPKLYILGLCLVTFSVGIIRMEVASWQFVSSPLAEKVGEEITFEGVVIHEPDERARTVHLYVAVDKDIVLVSTDRLINVSYGDRLTVTGKIKRPESFVTELGRTFDYPGYLLAKGVQYQISFADVTVVSEGHASIFIAELLSLKESFVRNIDTTVIEPAAGLGKGLLLGIKSALGDDVERDFRRAGLTHIVVLSGYNVMLVVAFMLFCASFIFGLRTRVVVGLAGIIAFALIVGLSATVVRASIMASLVLLARLFGRKYDVLRALCFAGAVMIFINPYILVYDIGFQLSFMATLGLVLMLPRFESTTMTETKQLHLREFLLATIVTQIAVLPLLWYHIGEVSVIAVLVNVLVLPIVPFAMLATFVAGVAAFVSQFLGLAFGFVAWLLLQSILIIAHIASSLPFATIILPQISAWFVLLMYAALFLMWWILSSSSKVEDTLRGWVIEEEKGGASLDAPPEKEEIPVFFR